MRFSTFAVVNGTIPQYNIFIIKYSIMKHNLNLLIIDVFIILSDDQNR